MPAIFAQAGRIIGWLGCVLCALAGVTKISGSYYLLGFEALSVFIGGVGLIVAGIWIKLEARDPTPR